MLNLLLSALVLLLSWSAAHLLAIPAAYVTRRTRLGERLVVRTFRPFSGPNPLRVLRGLIFGLILIALDLALAAVLGITPLHTLWKNYIQNFVDFELTQTILSGLLDNLVLFLGIFMVYQAVGAINTFFPRVYEIMGEWRHTRFHIIRLKSLELLTPDQITDFSVSLVRYLQIGLNILLVAIGATFLFSFFPGTQAIVFNLVDGFANILKGVGQALLDFMPNLFTLLIILVATRYALKLLHFIYDGLRRGKIKLAGLHPELAEPTYQLLRFFTVALALVTAYPYIPGSDSPVFRGITIFTGFLLSLGSTSLVTNIISGVVLTYTRGLKIGDRVKIGDTVGDVIERTLLVTRVRTIKNVVITIPNGMVLNNQIINFSAPTTDEGLILNTTVTIGYDVPWRQVHDLLVNAALETRAIMKAPQPFVFQTSLDDYYVSYELNAYTKLPEQMAATYSELHQNIQDHFHGAGVEIMSPGYTAFRDGNEAAIPSFQHSPKPRVSRPTQAMFTPPPTPKNGVDTLPLNSHGVKTRPL